MAYKLVCVHEFFDDISGKVINRGEEVHDYEHMAKLVAADRVHHFVKVQLVMADAQWEWPPVVGEETPAATPAAAPAATEE
jgi:hypothetical protein